MDAASARTWPAWLSWIVLVAAVVGAAALWQARASAVEEEAEEVDPLAGDVELGAQLYAQHCAACHASDGTATIVPGTDRRAPALQHSLNPQVTAAYVDLVIRTGRMPPAADPFDNQPREVVLDDEERAAVVAFSVEQFDLPTDIPELPEEGDPGDGQLLYAANCASCHGATGGGGVAGGGAVTPNVNRFGPIAVAEAIRVGPFQMPAFGPDQLSNQEMADIAVFLEEVRAESGTPVGLVELNPVFASGFVALLALVMILSLFWISAKPTWFPDAGADEDGDAPTDQAVAEARTSDDQGGTRDE